MIPIKHLGYTFFLLLISVKIFAQAPWDSHGQLEVASNGHYIAHEDGTPFYGLPIRAGACFRNLPERK